MNRLLVIVFLVIVFVPHNSYGQKSEVYEELSNALEYGSNANDYAASALYYINKCYDQTSIEDIKYYARYAKSEIDYAKTQTGYAKSDASDAEDEAEEISCDDAEYEADNAEEYFYSAKNKFNDAYAYLSSAEYSDDKENIEYNLRKGQSCVEEGITYLNYALSDLNDAVDDLNYCD